MKRIGEKILGHIAESIGAGVPMLIIAAVFLWLFSTFFSGMDEAIQAAVSLLPGIDFHYPSLGIIIAFPVAYLVGLLMKITWLRNLLLAFMRRIPMVGMFFYTIIETFSGHLKHSPVIEVEYPSEGHYVRGWLTETRQQFVKKKNGSSEMIIAYTCFLPTANNPTSGWVNRTDPSRILYVCDNSSRQLLLNIFFFGKLFNDWNRREFDVNEFPPVRLDKETA